MPRKALAGTTVIELSLMSRPVSAVLNPVGMVV